MKNIIESGNGRIVKAVCKPTLMSPILVNKQLASIFNEEPYVVYIKEQHDSEMYSGIKVFSYFEDIPNAKEYSWSIYYFEELNRYLIRYSIWDKGREIDYLIEKGICKETFDLNTMESVNIYLDDKDSLYVNNILEKFKKQFYKFNGYVKSSNQQYFNEKKVYINYFTHQKTEVWSYPLDNKVISSEIDIIISQIKNIVESNKNEIYKIELDYRCPLDVHYKYITGAVID